MLPNSDRLFGAQSGHAGEDAWVTRRAVIQVQNKGSHRLTGPILRTRCGHRHLQP